MNSRIALFLLSFVVLGIQSAAAQIQWTPKLLGGLASGTNKDEAEWRITFYNDTSREVTFTATLDNANGGPKAIFTKKTLGPGKSDSARSGATTPGREQPEVSISVISGGSSSERGSTGGAIGEGWGRTDENSSPNSNQDLPKTQERLNPFEADGESEFLIKHAGVYHATYQQNLTHNTVKIDITMELRQDGTGTEYVTHTNTLKPGGVWKTEDGRSVVTPNPIITRSRYPVPWAANENTITFTVGQETMLADNWKHADRGVDSPTGLSGVGTTRILEKKAFGGWQSRTDSLVYKKSR